MKSIVLTLNELFKAIKRGSEDLKDKDCRVIEIQSITIDGKEHAVVSYTEPPYQGIGVSSH